MPVYLGLDCTAEELGMKDYTVFISNTSNSRKQYETIYDKSYYIINCLNNLVEDASPEGTSIVWLSIPYLGKDLPSVLKAEDYKKFKNEIAKKYIEDAEETLGIDITSHIEEIAVATPVTFARYLGTPEGTIYGYKLAGWDSLMARTQSEREDFNIPGLSFCGGHHIRGDGYSSAYITGNSVSKTVIRKLAKEAD